MRFPKAEQLMLPCQFERFVPGELHPDGRRYLPLLIFRMAEIAGWRSSSQQLGVVDRHHRIDPALEGRSGQARLVFLLSSLRYLEQPPALGFEPEVALQPGRVSMTPVTYGQVLEVMTWQVLRGKLPYDVLETELLLDVGGGVIGVRTSVTAPSLYQRIGTEQVQPGDWLELQRSRIDLLGFEPIHD